MTEDDTFDTTFNKFIASDDDLKEIVESSDDKTISNAPVEELSLVTIENETAEEVVNDAVKRNIKHSVEIETDYQYVRSNLHTITDRSIQALENLSQIADQSQHPRAYEVLSQLVKTIADAQKNLIDLHRDKIKIDEQKAEQTGQAGAQVTNNNLFVGTAAGLDELIAEMIKPKKDA